MTDRPVLFSGPMVRALLDGRKTQTRRVLKRQPKVPFEAGVWYRPFKDSHQFQFSGRDHLIHAYCNDVVYIPGDRLWVRERFAVSGIGWGKKPSEARGGKVHFHADPEHGWHDYWGSWRPSIHMPRWASRLTLTVTDVRIQRLQEISEDDARAEGVEPYTPTCPDDDTPAADAFMDLWDSLNAERAPWDSNPWVVALTFTVQRGNIDQVGLTDRQLRDQITGQRA